jgi:hypothetical protein
MHGCCTSFQFWAGIRAARLWCSQQIKYPGFLKKSFWCWMVLLETAPSPAGYHGGT